MTEHVTTWTQGPDVVLTRDVGGQVHEAIAPLHISPQYDTSGPPGTTPIPLTPEPNDSLVVMKSMDAQPSFTGLLGVEYGYALVVLFHFAWAQNWFSSETVRPLAVPVIDDDADQWRIDAAVALGEAFSEANPDAYNVQVEWEGWDFTGRLFGVRHDRSVKIITTGTANSAASHLIGVEADPISPRPETVDSAILYPPLEVKVAPEKAGVVSGTYLQGVNITTNQADFSFSLDEFAGIETLETLPSDGAFHETDVSIDDTVFDTNALPLEHQGAPWRRTRSLLLWVVPDSDVVRRFSNGLLVEYDVGLIVTSNMTPPRYRIRYYTDTVPIQQTFARDDELAGGAFQTWPPPTSEQRSNVTFGSYR